jgi:penicillin-binding protein 1A
MKKPSKDASDRRKVKKSTFLLELDSWIDSSLYESRFAAGETWESVMIFFRRFRARGPIRYLFELLGYGLTAGAAGSVLMLLLALPAFDETTRDWRSQDDFAVTFLDRYGNKIGQRGIIQRDSVPVDEMPDHVIKAVLATEDRRFFDHYGIDFLGLARAMGENVRAQSVVQGGSTLTQQLAKNLFLSNERTFERKIKEAFLAEWLEVNLTKKEILQLYLDRAYMGGGTFGIAAATDFYFGKEVKDLNLAEAAMLAGLFKAPAKYAPHINLPAARARANEVLTNLVQAGFMTEGQVIAARRKPADVIERDSLESPDYFLDWAFEEVKRIAGNFPNHSLVARTTIDKSLQKAAEESVNFNLAQFGKQYDVDQAALVLIENTGAVRAIVGGRDYGESQYNRATRALRQAGSSFKPYVYTAAMENGYTPESVVPDTPITWNGWSPQNYGRSFAGRVNLTTALVKSINTVPVRLAKEKLGIEPIWNLAHEMGVESPLEKHKTMVLGTSGMTVMDQATGYLTLADGGEAGKRHAITQLMTYGGDVLWDFTKDGPKPKKVVSDQAVASMNTILAQVPEWGTARRAAIEGMRTAGKTGTTQAYRDAWFVGYTGNYTAAVWMGNDDFTATKNLTGGSVPAMIWNRLMTYAHQNIELKPIPGLANPGLPESKHLGPQIAEDEAEPGAEPVAVEAERPRLLSEATTRWLRGLGATFRDAPALDQGTDPTTVSAL